MVTSRENVINGGYKTANTRPISVSFSPFPSPSRLMNPPPLPSLPSFPTRSLPQKMQNLSSWTVHLRFRHRIGHLEGTWRACLMSSPTPPNVQIPPELGNFLTAEKSHPPRGWFVLWNPSWDLCSNRGASLVKGINSKVESEMWARMKRR